MGRIANVMRIDAPRDSRKAQSQSLVEMGTGTFPGLSIFVILRVFRGSTQKGEGSGNNERDEG